MTLVFFVPRLTLFLSTPSARRATYELEHPGQPQAISIHALREEGDVSPRGVSSGCPQFLSTPSARRAPVVGARLKFLRDNFYPRPPRGGRRCYVVAAGASLVFLSTPSARRATVARPFIVGPQAISIHALREEGDCDTLSRDAFARLFLSTPSARRATSGSRPRRPWRCNFYPRPPRGGRLM